MKHFGLPIVALGLALLFTLGVTAGGGKMPFKFSHKAHEKMTCDGCHKSAPKPGDRFAMKPCYTCHQKKRRALANCRVCHQANPDGRLKTPSGMTQLLPPDWIKGPTHKTGWVGSHARIAGADSRFCANCHKETFCSDCHTGKRRPRDVHPGDWLKTHGVSSSMDSPSCQGCHRSQSFCITCHRRAGVAPDSPTARRGERPGNFHKNASPAQICRRARTNVTACASCHSESSCVTCHARINPHPAGFARRCKKLAKQNRRACLKCHQGNPELLCR